MVKELIFSMMMVNADLNMEQRVVLDQVKANKPGIEKEFAIRLSKHIDILSRYILD